MVGGGPPRRVVVLGRTRGEQLGHKVATLVEVEGAGSYLGQTRYDLPDF